MKTARRRNLLTKIASLRSRVFFKKTGLFGDFEMRLKTDKGKSVRVGVMSVGDDGKVAWSSLEPKFRGTGLGRLMYSRVLQRLGKLKGDTTQSGLAHGVYQSLPKPRRAPSKKPLAMSAEKMREKGLEPERLVPTRTTLYQLPGEFRRVRLHRDGKKKGWEREILRPRPSVPLKLYRPGSKEAKAQAKRMIAAGEDPSNWTTKAQIKRWKGATGSRLMKGIDNVSPRLEPKKQKHAKERLREIMSEKGLRPMRYESRGGKRATKPSPIEVENTLKTLFPNDPKRAKAELEDIRKKGGYFIGLNYDAARKNLAADRLSELRAKNPKDFGRPYGTIMASASDEVKNRYAQQRAKAGNPLGIYESNYPNLYNARIKNPKARSADHFYTEDRMSPRYQRKMRKKGKSAPSEASGQSRPKALRRVYTPSEQNSPQVLRRTVGVDGQPLPDNIMRKIQDLMGG